MPVAPTPARAPRVLIVSTSFNHVPGTRERAGLFLSELSTPFHALRARGATVDVATIAGGMPPLEPRSIDSPQEQAILKGPALNRALRTAPSLASVDASKYDAIILAGGHGALFDYPSTPAVRQAVEAVYARGGIAAAICHGANGLVDAVVGGRSLVEGRRVTGYSDAEDRLSQRPDMRPLMTESRMRARRADLRIAAPRTSHVEVDGRVITGQNPESAQAFSRAVGDALGLPRAAAVTA